jgi:hypothetical protein
VLALNVFVLSLTVFVNWLVYLVRQRKMSRMKMLPMYLINFTIDVIVLLDLTKILLLNLSASLRLVSVHLEMNKIFWKRGKRGRRERRERQQEVASSAG